MSYDHTRVKAPHPIRTAKLSTLGPDQYFGRGLQGNLGCCKSFLFFSLATIFFFFCKRFFFFFPTSQFAKSIFVAGADEVQLLGPRRVDLGFTGAPN